MAKTLIVFYSLSGTTRRVAQELKHRSGWDLAEIKDTRPRKGFWGYTRCMLEVRLGLSAAIEYNGPDPSAYDLVLLGSPVWAWRIASPLRGFVTQRRDRMKRVAFFFTFGGGGADKVTQEANALAGDANAPVLFLSAREMQSGTFLDRLNPFLERLRAASA
jgi:flavodoxin